MENQLGRNRIGRKKIVGARRGCLLSILFLLSLFVSSAQVQLSTVYVDALNGSDSFSGANPTDTPAGSGPKATIHAGLVALADGGRLILFAGAYAGDGIDTDGSPTNGGDNADINIGPARYPQLTTGLTIELRSLGVSNEVRIAAEANTVRATNGALINHDADQYVPNFLFNIPGGTLTFVTTNGSEFLSLSGRHSSGSPIAGLSLVAGTFDIARGSSFRLLNGSAITITGSARFLREAPQKQSDLNVTYLGSGSFSAGAEASYPSFGSGVLTIAKDSGTTITFPSSIAFSGSNDALRIQSGNAVFNGSLILGSAAAASGSLSTADLVISTNGNVTFNAPVALGVVNGAVHDSTISTIDNSGSGVLSFQQAVTWYAAAPASDKSFPASEATAIVWNAGNGSMVFASGIVLSHELASGADPATVEVSIQNDGRGSLKFLGPLRVVSRSSTNPVGVQRFSASAINAGGGTLEISGTLGARLVNARSGRLAGTVNITGPTTLGTVGTSSGMLINARDAVVNLGPHTLTMSGTTNQVVNESYFTCTSGGILIDAEGAVGFDGGSLSRITIQQPPGGSTIFSSAASFIELVVNSGNCLLQSAASVAGGVEVNGGGLTIEDRAGALLLAGSFRQKGGTSTISSPARFNELTVSSGNCLLQSSVTVADGVELTGGTLTVQDGTGASLLTNSFHQTGGIFDLGGARGGALKLLGDFRRSAGSFNAGSASSVIIAGSIPQTVDPGSGLQLGALIVENGSGLVRCLQPLKVSTDFTIGFGAHLDLGTSTVLLNGVSAVFTNNGSFDASGLGIVLGGTSTLPGGASLSGSEIHAGPGSRFTSFTIDIGFGNSCAFKADEAAEWSGTLSLLSGELDIASQIDLSPGGSSSHLRLDVTKSKGIVRSGGTFNASERRFAMQLLGAMQADYTMQPELVTDLLNVDTLSIDVNSDTEDNDGNLKTGQPRYFQFPSGVFVFGGSLVVGPVAAVRLLGDGKSGGSIELTGSLASHRVRGMLTLSDAGDAIVIGGEKATLTGSTLPGDPALVGTLAVRSTSLCRVSAIRGFLGSVTTLPGSSLAFSMGTRSTERVIAGSLILNGSVFALEGNIEVRQGVAFNSGKLNFGTYNLQVSTSGDFFQSPSASGYEAAGGSLVMNRPQGHLKIGSTDQLGLPNLQILADTYLDTLGRVTKNLVIGSQESDGLPTLYLGRTGNDLIFTGSSITILSNGSGNREAIVSDGTTDGTFGGRLFVIGVSVTVILNGDFSIEELVYNPPAIDGTLSILSMDLTPRVLTISDILTHAGGQIGLGSNHLALTGTGMNPGHRAYNRSDGTIGASSGEIRFVGRAPQQFSCGVGSSMPNLRIWNSSGVSKSQGSDPMIVTRTLDLSDGMFTFNPGTLIIENGASIIRRRSAATISSTLSFRSSVNISYLVDADNGNLFAGSEMPFDPSVLQNLTIEHQNTAPDSSAVILFHDIGVRERIVLGSGRLDVGAARLTLAPGGTIEIRDGRLQSSQGSTGELSVSTYELVFSKSGVITPASEEFPTGPGITVSKLSVVGGGGMPTLLRLYANRTVEKLFLDAPRGGIEIGAPGSFVARNLTVRDSLTIRSGGFTNTSGANAILTLAGTKKQILMLPDTGVTLPGGTSAIHLQFNNPEGFRLLGGDLRLSAGSIIFFANGVLDAGDRCVVLSRSVAGQGFDRQGVTGSNISHIVGGVRQSITGGAGNPDVYPNGRYEFPTGSLTHYRPVAIDFKSEYPAKNPGSIQISHVDRAPAGIAGLPLDGGLGVRIGAIAPFYWSIQPSEGSFGEDQRFDLEISSESPGFRLAKPGEARLIARPNTAPETSPWKLVGSGVGDGPNGTTLTSRGDTVLIMRLKEGANLLSRDAFLTVGIPIDRRPYLNFRIPASFSQVALNVPITFLVSITDPESKPVTVVWKINEQVVKEGADTSLTVAFQGLSTMQSVRAVFSNSGGLADSTEWRFLVVSVDEETTVLPTEVLLGNNYPNPFNPATAIPYQIRKASFVSIKVYDLLGREVAQLAQGVQAPGFYTVRWIATGLPSGTYICRFSAIELASSLGQGPQIQSRRMVLAK